MCRGNDLCLVLNVSAGVCAGSLGEGCTETCGLISVLSEMWWNDVFVVPSVMGARGGVRKETRREASLNAVQW